MDLIVIDPSELAAPEVDRALARQLSFGMADTAGPRPKTRLVHRPWFSLMLAGGLGALAGWALYEPFFTDGDLGSADRLLFFPIISGLVGLGVGVVDGILSRATRRAIISGLVGLAMGFGLCCALQPLFETFYFLATRANDSNYATRYWLWFILQMTIRGFAWALAGVAVGVGQGMALHSSRLLRNGVLGGIGGGLLGGLLFDPICELLPRLLPLPFVGGELSRAVGFTVIGLATGFMVGLVEALSCEARLKMASGPIQGKEFMLHRNPTVIGSSPKADVYLFKDAEVAPTHALLHQGPAGYELEDRGSATGTFVNGMRIRRRRLGGGDLIRIGGTLIRFEVRTEP